ncbi:MAG: (2Fe-2S)-binding protein [Acidimicrobiia bacterium]|nr:(2Fe-2S)-binding protein [Acidimicrobiia bacterium]MYC57088.1 (2Fe-2S)-binding protein [Acidimicrobiia bacterium]MYG94810.1 (2Fe-2S)-binding protein [Acidimicrobiia bacterium]MYI30165.1 (2Fe-2S)-binding protein [Acidimicrobiia bacterium]
MSNSNSLYINPYSLRVNGANREVADSQVSESLLFVLRERLGCTGTKNACTEGECGSCVVLVDGVLTCSCLVLAATVVGREITTIEGLGIAESADEKLLDERGGLLPVQQAFVDEGAVQCGFCTPGLIVAVHDLLEANPNPSEGDVREALSGNLCRCTGYGRILAAVRSACEQMRSPL